MWGEILTSILVVFCRCVESVWSVCGEYLYVYGKCGNVKESLKD